LSNGESVLIEGKPSYIDHLAICSDGVWDKGNGPSGINLGETTVTDEMKDEKRSDAESMEERMDALMKRMDAIENKGGDEYPTKEMRVDKKRADEEGKEEKAEEKEAEAVKELQEAAKEEKEAKAEEKKEEKKDSQARSDADLRSQIASLNARLSTLSTQPSMEERDAMASAQSRADKIARLFGDSVSPPVAGESSIEYRKRLAAKFQKHCDKFKSVRLDSLEGPVFDEVERTIYADAQTSALNPASAPEGRLIPDVSIDPAGRSITRYHGDPLAWMKHFMTGSQSVRFNRNSGKEIN
ncbi:MAG: NUDIX hydrolase, partial [Pseudomonadota bacterium]|nr:NUDIX hydrolase [Pseudomonadota bacterium]